jgi:hypothetical protein
MTACPFFVDNKTSALSGRLNHTGDSTEGSFSTHLAKCSFLVPSGIVSGGLSAVGLGEITK